MNTESEWKELGATGNPELLGDFIVEAREHLSDIQMRLRSIDPHPGNAPASASCDAEALNAIFRAFHTIKGLAGFLNLSALAQVAHEMETLLAVARTGELVIASEHIEVILAGSRDLARRIDELDTHTSTGQELGAHEHRARAWRARAIDQSGYGPTGSIGAPGGRTVDCRITGAARSGLAQADATRAHHQRRSTNRQVPAPAFLGRFFARTRAEVWLPVSLLARLTLK